MFTFTGSHCSPPNPVSAGSIATTSPHDEDDEPALRHSIDLLERMRAHSALLDKKQSECQARNDRASSGVGQDCERAVFVGVPDGDADEKRSSNASALTSCKLSGARSSVVRAARRLTTPSEPRLRLHEEQQL